MKSPDPYSTNLTKQEPAMVEPDLNNQEPGMVVRAYLPLTGVTRMFTLGRDYVWRCGAWGYTDEDFRRNVTVTEVFA